MLKTASLIVLFVVPGLCGQFYEDKRCRCVCPSISAMLNRTLSTDQQLFIAYVPPSQCTCDVVILPKFFGELKGSEQEVCAKCECKYEMRNTTIIFVVVILVIWVIALLLLYLIFLTCLDPFARRKRQIEYNTQTYDEAETLLNSDDDY